MIEGWTTAQLKNLIAFVIGGDWGKAPDFDDADYVDVLCIRGTELRSWAEHRGASAARRRIKASSLAKRELRQGDVILEVSGGGPEQPVGRVELIDKAALAHHQGTPRICTNFFRRLQLIEGIDPAYVVHFLKFFYSTGEIRKYQAGSNNLRNLKYPEYETIDVPLAPFPEQQRIVEKIETLFAELDKGEEALRQVRKLLTRYRQAVLKAAVTGDLTADWRGSNGQPQETGEELLARILKRRRETWRGRGKYKEPVEPKTQGLPELPSGWVWSSVDQVTTVFRNGLSKKPRSEPNDFPILRISAVRPMEVSFDDLRYYTPSQRETIEDSWVSHGDLLFTRYSGSAHLVGVCGLIRGEKRVLYPDKLIRATPMNLPGLSRDFLEIAWNAGATRRHIAANTKTTSGQQGIAGGDIKAAPFPLPPGGEQEVIAELVSETLDRIQQTSLWCETELKRSSALRQSVLRDAFSGKLVPQDPSDEPAKELLERTSRSTRDELRISL